MAKTTGTFKQAALASGKASQSKSKTVPSTLSEEVVVESSSDAESESDSEIDEHDETTAKLVAKQTNGAKPAKAAPKTATSSEESSEDSSEKSSEESDSEDESAQSPTPVKSAAAAKTNGIKRKPSIEDVAMSDAESDHRSKKAKVSTKEPAQPSAASTQPAVNHALPVIPYEAPRGYKKAQLSDNCALSQADMKGKVVWHISAPKDVPLHSLSGVSQAKIDAKKPVLSHNGIDYILVEAEPVQSAILLPDSRGYRSAGKTVSKTYSLRPAFTLPVIPAIAASRNAGSAVAANIATAAVTAIRPQPKGLKMRYRPPGFGDGKIGRIGDSSDEEDNEESIYQFSKAVGPSTDGDGTMVGDGVAKKKRKDKKTKHDKINGIAHDNEARPVPAAEHESNADADEARRKAEKRAKKAAKRKALEQS